MQHFATFLIAYVIIHPPNKLAQNIHRVCTPGPFLGSTSQKRFTCLSQLVPEIHKLCYFCITIPSFFQPWNLSRWMLQNIYEKIGLCCPLAGGCASHSTEKIKVEPQNLSHWLSDPFSEASVTYHALIFPVVCRGQCVIQRLVQTAIFYL